MYVYIYIHTIIYSQNKYIDNTHTVYVFLLKLNNEGFGHDSSDFCSSPQNTF